MRQVIWSSEATDDLFGISDRYELIDPQLAETMLDRIRIGPAALLDAPHIGSPVLDADRKWRVAGTPFLLFYTVASEAITILRVRHARSDWKR